MRIVEEKYFNQYNDLAGNQIDKFIVSFDYAEKSTDLGYKTQTSAVYSSNIEGNSIDLNSFMNYKLSQEKFKPQKEIQEIENLISAYEFAQSNDLNEKNFLHCHKILSKTLVIKSKQGKYRNDKVGVFGQSGLVYLAIEPEFVKEAMTEFFNDLDILIKADLSKPKVFYFASMIHLKFAHIHPFRDGNGRAARLLEKWFITEKLGRDFWKLSSEKYYREHQMEYYNNINLGVNYYTLNYDKCIPFLIMLPKSIENK
ncbi:MAG: Fic family protein [Bacteroidales bacterium]|nr:Fic family protein [Bacteroidales bacterium]